MAFTLQDAEHFLARLAPFARRLDFRISSFTPGRVTVIMPQNPDLIRDIGILCGQSILAAADSLGPLCIAGTDGAYREMATASLNCEFLRAMPQADIRIEAELIKSGRRLSLVRLNFYAEKSDKLGATATVTYAHL